MSTESGSLDSMPPVDPDGSPDDPENPLGERALYLGWPRYLIHGTNEPYGVGRRVSRGCIRLYPEHIEQLYELVGLGTKVRVIDEPIKLDWVGDTLYIEAHPTLSQAGELEEHGTFQPVNAPGLRERVPAIAISSADRVDWDAVERAVRERRGVPVAIIQGARPRPDWLFSRHAPK